MSDPARVRCPMCQDEHVVEGEIAGEPVVACPMAPAGLVVGLDRLYVRTGPVDPDAAPVEEFQLAVKEVVATDVAAVATGGSEIVMSEVVLELLEVFARPTARTR